MASSLFGSNAKPQASNPFQAAMAAAQELKHSNPEQLMEKMMEANPQFAAFVNQNKGKSILAFVVDISHELADHVCCGNFTCIIEVFGRLRIELLCFVFPLTPLTHTRLDSLGLRFRFDRLSCEIRPLDGDDINMLCIRHRQKLVVVVDEIAVDATHGNRLTDKMVLM